MMRSPVVSVKISRCQYTRKRFAELLETMFHPQRQLHPGFAKRHLDLSFRCAAWRRRDHDFSRAALSAKFPVGDGCPWVDFTRHLDAVRAYQIT